MSKALLLLLCFGLSVLAQVGPPNNLCSGAGQVGNTLTLLNADGQTHSNWICAQTSALPTYGWKLVQSPASAPLGTFINGGVVPASQASVGTNALGQIVAGNAGTGTTTCATTSNILAGNGTAGACISAGVTPAAVVTAISQAGTAIQPLPPGTTASIGGGALTASCASGTAAIAGSTTAMAVIATPVADITSGGTVAFSVVPYVSTPGTVTVLVCGTGTPTATTYNVRIIQ